MKKSDDEAILRPEEKKRIWTPPRLSFLGHMQQFVLGGGKDGSNIDSDPHSPPGKSGVG